MAGMSVTTGAQSTRQCRALIVCAALVAHGGTTATSTSTILHASRQESSLGPDDFVFFVLLISTDLAIQRRCTHAESAPSVAFGVQQIRVES
jgi:hypothetical protein